MNGRNGKRALVALCAVMALAGSANAQEWSLGFKKKFGRHSSIAIGVHSGAGYNHKPNYGGGPGYGTVHHAPVPQFPVAHKVWVPGRYSTVRQQVWVPGHTEQVYSPPQYATQCDVFGNSYQVLVQPGQYQTVQHPGHYEVRPVQVWKPGHWKTVKY